MRQERDPLSDAYNDVPGSRPEPGAPPCAESGSAFVWALLIVLVIILIAWWI